MKELYNSIRQRQAYGDSYGECAVLLEDGETIKDVIKTYVDVNRAFYERVYSNARLVKEYNSHKGNIVVMDVFRAYLD